MSIKIMTAVWAYGPSSPHQRLMLLALADQANDEGYTWPSTATLAAKAAVGERAAQRTLDGLEADGWIATVPRPGRSTMYQVLMTRLTPVVDDTPVAHDTPVVHDTPTPVAHDTPGVSSTTPEPSRNRQVNRHTPAADVPDAGSAPQAARYSEDFERFWSAYPKRKDKKSAWRMWQREVVKARVPVDTVVAAAGRYAAEVRGKEDRYTKAPATWLNATDFDEADDGGMLTMADVRRLVANRSA